MHSRRAGEAITDEIVAAWEDAKKQGKIRFIGVSTHNPNAIVDRVLQVGQVRRGAEHLQLHHGHQQ